MDPEEAILSSTDSPDLPRITDGVFFTTPARLPKGPHGLSRDEVREIQRERLMIAYTELVAAHGYHDVGVRDLVARSTMSRSAFYDCFENLDLCADAAYQRFITVLLTEMTSQLTRTAVSHDIPVLIGAYLGTLQRDLVVARAFQLEFDAAGRTARRRRRDALRLMAEFLRAEHNKLAADDPTLDPDLNLEVFLGAIYAIRQLTSDLLDTEDEHDLSVLLPRVSEWLTNGLRR